MISKAKISLCLTFLSISTVVTASERPRSETEAIGILRAVLAGENYNSPSDSTVCRVDSVWAKEPIPRELAREVFGIDLQADLVAPEPVPEAEDILANAVSSPEQLCPRSTSQGPDIQASEETPPFKHSWRMTYPVFDASFKKGIVIFYDLYARKHLSFTSFFLIFAKHGGKWKLTKSVVDGET